MMLCGFYVVLTFLLGRMLDVMRSQRRIEYWQLLVRLEASKALGYLQHAGGGPAERHGLCPSFAHLIKRRQLRFQEPAAGRGAACSRRSSGTRSLG
jgi:hypothetical protein